MAQILLLLLLTSSLFIPSYTQNLQSTDQEAFISILISQQGLGFVKDLLIKKAISSIIPLKVFKIERVAKIPFLGNVEMGLSNITINEIDVLSSYVNLGDTGVSIIVSGANCNISMSWYYQYYTWLVPLEIFDEGTASVKVEDMQVGLTLGLENQNGTLKLSLEDCGFYVKDISIELDGGKSWLYKGLIDAFEEPIGPAVENAITKKLQEGILKLDSFLQALPKVIPIDDNASLNLTFVKDPSVSNTSIGFDINGLFIGRRNISVPTNEISVPTNEFKSSESSVFCSDTSKMLSISLDEAVFNSASASYYDAKFMQWVVNKVPDQNLLNTAGWRIIIPTLYRKYPNADMNLNISLSFPPIIRISEHDIAATVYVDLIIDVLKGDEVIPVACISLDIRGSGSVSLSGNKLGGSVKVSDFSMSLKWSNIGKLRLYLVQPMIWTLIQTVLVPYANVYLKSGFSLPSINGFAVKNAELICSDSKIVVCGDLDFTELS